jgi:hypothetical protein
VFGAIGVDGRVVEEPTVVPVPLFSAVRGPLQGAHINKSAKTAIAAISAIIPAPIPLGRVGSVLVVRLRFWLSLSISFSSVVYRSNRPRRERFLPQPISTAVSISSPQEPSVKRVPPDALKAQLLCQAHRYAHRLPGQHKQKPTSAAPNANANNGTPNPPRGGKFVAHGVLRRQTI